MNTPPVTDSDIQEMRELIIRLNRRKKANLSQTPNWEVDEYYERNLKKFDSE